MLHSILQPVCIRLKRAERNTSMSDPNFPLRQYHIELTCPQTRHPPEMSAQQGSSDGLTAPKRRDRYLKLAERQLDLVHVDLALERLQELGDIGGALWLVHQDALLLGHAHEVPPGACRPFRNSLGPGVAALINKPLLASLYFQSLRSLSANRISHCKLTLSAKVKHAR